jgi:hypothetical protein
MKKVLFWIILRKQLLTFWARGKIFDFVNRKQRHHEGWCMCGSKVEDHGYWDGHGPVDAWYYNRDEFVYRKKK